MTFLLRAKFLVNLPVPHFWGLKLVKFWKLEHIMVIGDMTFLCYAKSLVILPVLHFWGLSMLRWDKSLKGKRTRMVKRDFVWEGWHGRKGGVVWHEWWDGHNNKKGWSRNNRRRNNRNNIEKFQSYWMYHNNYADSIDTKVMNGQQLHIHASCNFNFAIEKIWMDKNIKWGKNLMIHVGSDWLAWAYGHRDGGFMSSSK